MDWSASAAAFWEASRGCPVCFRSSGSSFAAAPATQQRATYQPFNLIVLALASVAMALAGQITRDVLWIAACCLPATIVGAWIGARVYIGVSAQTFQRVVLTLCWSRG